MNNKAIIKLIIILTISTTLTFLIRKITYTQFPDFVWDNQKIVYCFIMVLLIINIVYNSLGHNKNTMHLLAKSLAWASIFLAIIIGYAFRFELNYATQRIMSVLIPSYNWVNKQGELVISRSSDGHFYITALVNGIKIKFMVDTGASDVALTAKDAKILGFDLAKLNYTKQYSTANGISNAAAVKLDSVMINNVTLFKNVAAHVNDGGLDVSLLGMSLLERFKGVRLDRDMLILSYTSSQN